MQSGINGYEIYKNLRMMHAVVFADRAPEAKNAQVMSQTQNSNGLKKRVLPTEGGEHFFAKNGPQTDQKSTQSGSDLLKSDRVGPNPGPIRFWAAPYAKVICFAEPNARPKAGNALPYVVVLDRLWVWKPPLAQNICRSRS